jgi:hypothetical protein
MTPWNREDELGVGDPDTGSTPGPFLIGGMNVGRSGLLGGVFGISENVDCIGCIGWFEYGEGSAENTDSFPGELSGELVEPPAERTASVDGCVSSFESGPESEIDSGFDR